ncbi:hypothetical protein ACPCTO_18195 [Streptomyces olivoreticuli]
MTKTMQMASVCWVLAAALFLVACVGPQAIYWGSRAWQYRDPKANEPSAAAYAVQRGGEEFTISSRKTGNPYCLTVTTGVSVKNVPTEPTDVSLIATARQGACRA